jgi:DNA polymerase-3 subunit alpha
VARGSAAGSIVTYLLGNRECRSDSDTVALRALPQSRARQPARHRHRFRGRPARDVIEYVRQKYGRDCVAQIITFGTMGAKSVVRDVGA